MPQDSVKYRNLVPVAKFSRFNPDGDRFDRLNFTINGESMINFAVFHASHEKKHIMGSIFTSQLRIAAKEYEKQLDAGDDVVSVIIKSALQRDGGELIQLFTLGRSKKGVCYITLNRDGAQAPIFKFAPRPDKPIIVGPDETKMSDIDTSREMAVEWVMDLLDTASTIAASIAVKLNTIELVDDYQNKNGNNTSNSGSNSRSSGGGSKEEKLFEDDIPF